MAYGRKTRSAPAPCACCCSYNANGDNENRQTGSEKGDGALLAARTPGRYIRKHKRAPPRLYHSFSPLYDSCRSMTGLPSRTTYLRKGHGFSRSGPWTPAPNAFVRLVAYYQHRRPASGRTARWRATIPPLPLRTPDSVGGGLGGLGRDRARQHSTPQDAHMTAAARRAGLRTACEPALKDMTGRCLLDYRVVPPLQVLSSHLQD